MITIKKKESFRVFADGEAAEAAVLAHGVGVSGSALAGRVAFNVDNIARLKEQDPAAAIILVRQDTVPEDIKEIAAVDGLLTARGGQTSHAAVVATRLEKTCVVGQSRLKLRAEENPHFLDQLKDPPVGDFVVDEVCVLAVIDNSLPAQNVEMLRDIGVGRLHLIPYFSHRELVVLEEAEYLQPDRMGHRFEKLGHRLNLFVVHLISWAILPFSLIPLLAL
jgi:phosphohistidine swiveling domain-containing protein